METLERIWHSLQPALMKIPLRFLSERDFLSWRWFATCFVVALACTLIFSPNLYRSWRRMKAHATASRVRRELALDLKFVALKMLVDPLKLAFFGGLFVTLARGVELATKPMMRDHLPQNLYVLDAFYGGIAAAIFSVMVWDIAYYLFHKLSHDWPALWELHSTHHRARYLTPLTKYRDHPLSEMVYNVFSGVFVGLAVAAFNTMTDIPKEGRVISSYEILVVGSFFLGHLRHSPIWISYGPLSYIFISPAMHQIHHSRRPEHIGKNLGVVFSFWDAIFGTLYIPRKKEKLWIGMDPLLEPTTRGMKDELVIPIKNIWQLCAKKFQRSATPLAPRDRSKQAGFSLLELMVSIPATLLMTLALGAAIIGIYAMSSRTVTNITAEQELNLMVNSLRSVSRAGINVRYFASALPTALRNTRSTAQEGYVHSTFTYSQFSHIADRQPVPIMYFARETATNSPSRPRATALFFVPPTATTPGQLQLTMVNTNLNPAPMAPCPVTGACAVANPPSIFLNNVVALRTFDAQFSPNIRMLDSVKMEITTRVFVTGSDKPKMHCPTADWATSCAQGGPYRDFTRTIVLQFDNNRRESMMAGFDFPFGLYFFKATGPRWYAD